MNSFTYACCLGKGVEKIGKMSFADELRKPRSEPAFDEAQWTDDYVNNCINTLKKECKNLSLRNCHQLKGYFKRYYDIELGVSYGFDQYGPNDYINKNFLARGDGLDIFYIVDEGKISYTSFQEIKRRLEEQIRALGFTSFHVQIKNVDLVKSEVTQTIFGNDKTVKRRHRASGIYLEVKW